MPRDVFGNYTLPAGNPVVTATVIASSWANTTLNDIATALTASLSVDGSVTVKKLKGLTAWSGTAGALSVDASGNFSVGGSNVALTTLPNILLTNAGGTGTGQFIIKYEVRNGVVFVHMEMGVSSGVPPNAGSITAATLLAAGFPTIYRPQTQSYCTGLRYQFAGTGSPGLTPFMASIGTGGDIQFSLSAPSGAAPASGGYNCFWEFSYPVKP